MAKAGKGSVCEQLNGTKPMKGPEAAQEEPLSSALLFSSRACFWGSGSTTLTPLRAGSGYLKSNCIATLPSPTLQLEELRPTKKQQTNKKLSPRKHQDKKDSIQFLILPQTTRQGLIKTQIRDRGGKLNTSGCFKHEGSTDSDSPALTYAAKTWSTKLPSAEGNH